MVEIDWEHPGIHPDNLVTELVTDRVCSIKDIWEPGFLVTCNRNSSSNDYYIIAQVVIVHVIHLFQQHMS